MVRDGASWTHNSLHLRQWDGYAHAVDIFLWVDGRYTWSVPMYRKVMQAFVSSAIELQIPIRLGGLWESVVDAGHIELDSNVYGSKGSTWEKEKAVLRNTSKTESKN